MSKLVLGVLGEHIAYSLSPRVFEWAFAKIGVPGKFYRFDLPPGQARDFLRAREGWTGLSVTTPYKLMAYEECQVRSGESSATGSVNAVVRTPQGPEGHNTDVAGFLYALDRVAGTDFRPRSVLVIGTGGAARAVIYALQTRGRQARMEVASRDPDRARTRLEPFLRAFSAHNCVGVDTAAHALKDFDLVVQATPVGSAKAPGSPLHGPLRFKTGAVVMELIYAPRKTLFLEQAEYGGARIQNGLPMLIAQAARSFSIWTGTEFPLQAAMDELVPELAGA